MKNNAFIIFLKYPELGKVKTRLAKVLGDQFVLNLYENFIKDLYNKALKISADVYVFYTKDSQSTENNIFWNTKFEYFKQQGNDLGKRMYNALDVIINKNYKKCVLIGSDSPDLPVEIINQAFQQLDSNNVVLGPSEDGGYYLIAINQNSLNKTIFNNVKWSTNIVLEQTINNILHEKMTYSLLIKWHDFDYIEDLKELIDNSANVDNNLYTFKFVKKNQRLLYEKL
jgi:uncharacterized protein